MNDEFILDQPPVGVMTDEARESLRLAIESTPDTHPDKAKVTRSEHADFESRIRANLALIEKEEQP